MRLASLSMRIISTRIVVRDNINVFGIPIIIIHDIITIFAARGNIWL
jgi:hypothetical protein